MRALLLLAVACGSEPASHNPPIIDAPVTVTAEPDDAALVDASTVATAAAPWTFAVISDIHVPNPRVSNLTHVIAALIEANVRLVVVTGDHTNGSADDPRRTYAGQGWPDVIAALEPLRAAGIAVLPIAGNHDTYLPWQADQYATTFQDLDRWAAPFSVHGGSHGHARAPFSYSVDVGDVHLSLAHLVEESVEPDVAHWLASDLEAAAGARHRIVFGHVPMHSVVSHAHAAYVARLGGILERGHATLHVAGHEHLVWDEDFALPGGGSVREVIVGCASGFYQYGPGDAAKDRSHCVALHDPKRREPMRCAMPHGGGAFEITRGRKNRHLQHARTTFTLFTVDGDTIDARPMTLDPNGRAIPFYL